jgi:hypothetical protein
VKLLKLLLALTIFLLACFVGFLAYMGMFSALNVAEQKIGPFTYAYEEFVGPYKKAGPVFAKVNNILSAQGVTGEKGVMVCFDNPSQVPANRLHSNCGAIIDDKDPLKVAAVRRRLKIGSFPRTDCMVVEFPAKNALSYMIAPMKVYPVMINYMAAKGYQPRESWEIYDMAGKKTVYIIPIRK